MKDKAITSGSISSISWFLMDGFWMIKWPVAALIFATLSLVMVLGSYIRNFAFLREKPTYSSQALLSWLCMNICWMHSESHPKMMFMSGAFLWMGIVLLILSVAFEKKIDFRRFRW